tara:strand:+ start:323 stop:835 length:513 start_codon:yes stop_codon:yes gene_type:complete
MPLILILGSMYSGKTTELLRRVDKLRAIHKNVLLVRSIIDTRNHAKVIQTHAGHAKPSTTFHTLQDVPYDQYDAIAIDEGQFFDDIETIIPHLHNTLVLIAALNGTYNKQNFGNIHKLLPHVDDIVFKKAYCALCSNITDAIFSKRLGNNTEEVDIGAKDKYLPVCRACF